MPSLIQRHAVDLEIIVILQMQHTAIHHVTFTNPHLQQPTHILTQKF